ncbi:hypothetical protein [Ochrobactrum sp. BTU1]|uniref:hypothetical protein n=1 Tax=Ochrobactrum sp. BTU1 TaxID=2840456 RepID=UPI001C040946|nr:hypothetical protein KMS41_16710 [Ochrobactrum sp. BTU1]
MDRQGCNIDAAFLNALRLGPQRIGNHGIPAPVARRLAAAGRAVVVGNEVRYVSGGSSGSANKLR